MPTANFFIFARILVSSSGNRSAPTLLLLSASCCSTWLLPGCCPPVSTAGFPIDVLGTAHYARLHHVLPDQNSLSRFNRDKRSNPSLQRLAAPYTGSLFELVYLAMHDFTRACMFNWTSTLFVICTIFTCRLLDYVAFNLCGENRLADWSGKESVKNERLWGDCCLFGSVGMFSKSRLFVALCEHYPQWIWCFQSCFSDWCTRSPLLHTGPQSLRGVEEKHHTKNSKSPHPGS